MAAVPHSHVADRHLGQGVCLGGVGGKCQLATANISACQALTQDHDTIQVHERHPLRSLRFIGPAGQPDDGRCQSATSLLAGGLAKSSWQTLAGFL
jgi:hypothetical protein